VGLFLYFAALQPTWIGGIFCPRGHDILTGSDTPLGKLSLTKFILSKFLKLMQVIFFVFVKSAELQGVDRWGFLFCAMFYLFDYATG